MKPRILGTVAALAMIPIGAPALAQSLSALEKAEAAVVEVWQKTPLTVRHAMFISEPAEMFGAYTPYSNTFIVGEKLNAYAEPVGYGWKDLGNGLFEFGFRVDVLVKKPDGQLLFGKENFAKAALQSRARIRDFNLNLYLGSTGVPPGDYVVEYKVHDIVKDQTTSWSLPFTLVK